MGGTPLAGGHILQIHGSLFSKGGVHSSHIKCKGAKLPELVKARPFPEKCRGASTTVQKHIEK